MRNPGRMLLAALLLAAAVGRAEAGQLAAVIKETFDKATPNAVSTVAGGDHTSHFFLGDQSSLAPASRQLNVALVTQLTSFPLASSSGGFTYNLNARGEVVPTNSPPRVLNISPPNSMFRSTLNFTASSGPGLNVFVRWPKKMPIIPRSPRF